MQLNIIINCTDDAVKGIAILTKYLQDSVRAQASVNVSLVDQNTKLIYLNQELSNEFQSKT